MNQQIKAAAETYAAAAYGEALELLRTLGRIPAPSHQEDRRAAFCRDWLLEQGTEDVTIDGAKNVVCKIGCEDHRDLIVFAAHTDIVFPDTDPLPLREEDGRLFAPGIGDDTANLVNLLMGAKYLLRRKPRTQYGILIVCNACEEGLGNLKGAKELFRVYGSRIKAFYSFDGDMPGCCSTAVGSHRYRISCKTTGGHSYSAYGNPSAIEILCRLVGKLYDVPLPTQAKTTCNVGRIEGSTTINSIAQACSILYEYRSSSQQCLEIMEERFRQAVDSCRDRGGELSVELLGVRPGNGSVDPAALEALTRRSEEIISSFCNGEIKRSPGSTDSNIPLSLGIPANTIGTVKGSLAHTREEWIECASLRTGLGIALSLMLLYTEM